MSIKSVLTSLGSVLLGLAVGLGFAFLAGEDPWTVLDILYQSAFGSRYDFGMTLFYATPLLFTGLSVSFALQAGLVNLGCEGQLAMGALAAAAVGSSFPELTAPWAIPVAVLAAFAAGAFWGFIPGWLRAVRGSHEVIVCIMMNFIAAGLASWLTIYFFRNPENQNPETRAIAPQYLLPNFSFFEGAPVGEALVLALLLTVIVAAFFRFTVEGFKLKAVGQNERAARAAGIPIRRLRILAMTVAGGLAGLVGVAEVLGNVGVFRLGFSPGFGFMGVAVALLGRNHPLGLVAAALLFGALVKGAGDLDLETENLTKDLALILQAMVILAVSAEPLWTKLLDSLAVWGRNWSRARKDVL